MSAEIVTPASRSIAAEIEHTLGRVVPLTMRGRVNKVLGTVVEASGIHAHVGELCELVTPGKVPLLAEVVGFQHGAAILTALGSTNGLSALSEVVPTGQGLTCAVGEQLLGRVLNALGEPLDAKGPIPSRQPRMPVHSEPVGALARRLITRTMRTGIRCIDGLLTIGEGQRVGVFSPPGVGKSTLLGMLARGSTADVNVVVLVGERGREVKEFIEHNLGAAGLAKTVMIVSTSDRPPMERIKSAYVGTTIAEYFRDQGAHVLLLVDSLTRFARAQREVGLASGEPPTRRSYPASIFSMLPQLLERAGQGEVGSITAVYSVLTEGDVENDPIAEEVRSILDGHIVLSRKLAAAGQLPAIDVLASVSRVMPNIISEDHRTVATRWRALLSRYEELEMLVQIGEYRSGADPLADEAVRVRPAMQRFLKQAPAEHMPFEQIVTRLEQVLDSRESV